MTLQDMEKNIVRRGGLIPCKTAFIDAHTPGSDQKENFTIIGGGVSESADQHVHISGQPRLLDQTAMIIYLPPDLEVSHYFVSCLCAIPRKDPPMCLRTNPVEDSHKKGNGCSSRTACLHVT